MARAVQKPAPPPPPPPPVDEEPEPIELAEPPRVPPSLSPDRTVGSTLPEAEEQPQEEEDPLAALAAAAARESADPSALPPLEEEEPEPAFPPPVELPPAPPPRVEAAPELVEEAPKFATPPPAPAAPAPTLREVAPPPDDEAEEVDWRSVLGPAESKTSSEAPDTILPPMEESPVATTSPASMPEPPGAPHDTADDLELSEEPPPLQPDESAGSMELAEAPEPPAAEPEPPPLPDIVEAPSLAQEAVFGEEPDPESMEIAKAPEGFDLDEPSREETEEFDEADDLAAAAAAVEHAAAEAPLPPVDEIPTARPASAAAGARPVAKAIPLSSRPVEPGMFEPPLPAAAAVAAPVAVAATRAPAGAAPNYIGLFSAGWFLRILALFLLGASVKWGLVEMDRENWYRALLIPLIGITVAVTAWAIGEAAHALRDIARNSYR